MWDDGDHESDIDRMHDFLVRKDGFDASSV
jgi:hypothetical protein